MKLLFIGIVVSSVLINTGCDRTDVGGEPSLTYMIYINETTTEIRVKTYKFYPPNTMEILIRIIESCDSLVLISLSDDFIGSDSVDIIFNTQKMLRYHRNNVNIEKWSIYNMQDYESFRINEWAREVYRFTDQHLELAKDIDQQ